MHLSGAWGAGGQESGILSLAFAGELPPSPQTRQAVLAGKGVPTGLHAESRALSS